MLMVSGLVSVIIPIYNAENYIERCIESILSQTYKNIELLLINDGSKDNSYSICVNYAKKFQNIIVVSQDNSGPGAARNTGIAHATGEFIIFIDSDDTIDVNHVLDLLKAHNSNNTLVLCGYKRIYKDCIRNYSPNNRVLSKSDFKILIHEWLIDPIIGSPCNKLIEAKIIKENNLKFPENIIFAEDFIFSLKLFDCVDTIKSIDNCTYNYYMETPKSLSKVSNVDVKEWWDSEKFVYQQIKICLFLRNSDLPKEILCYLMLINFIRQIRIEKCISEYFIEDVCNDEEYKQCLREIKEVPIPLYIEEPKARNRRFLYKLLRLLILTDSLMLRKGIVACMSFIMKVY